MKRAITLSLVTAFAALTTSTALAQDSSGLYINLGATQLSTEQDLRNTEISGEIIDLGIQDIDITMITGRIGYRVNDFLAVEGEAGFGLGGDEITQTVPFEALGQVANVDANIGLDVGNYYIGFVRGILPAGDDFDIFARVGYGEAEASADVNASLAGGSSDLLASLAGLSLSTSLTEKASDFAYGVGAQYNFTDTDGVRVDYTRLDKTDIISLAYARRF